MVKFDTDLNAVTMYILTASRNGVYYCDCFAGNKATCRHRDMLKQFIATDRIDTEYFIDFENWRWSVPIKRDE